MHKYMFPSLILALIAGAHAHGISESQQQAILEGGNLRYMWLGAVHMLTGYDHLLFLFGVLFYLTGFKDIIKFITIFTVGHSITLMLATYLQITANYYLVDAVIALSVCYKAFDNLDGFRKYLGFTPPSMLTMVFVFGLIHGFGLSTRLQQLPLPDEGLFSRILSFNLGVELGQVAALSVMLILLAGWRRTGSFLEGGRLVNVLLLVAGIGLFQLQMHSYLHDEGHHHETSEEFAEDEHPHGMEVLPFDEEDSPGVDTGNLDDSAGGEESRDSISQTPATKSKKTHTHADGTTHHSH